MWEGWWEKLDSQLVWPPFCVDSQCNFLPQSNNMHAQVDGRFAPRCESESELCDGLFSAFILYVLEENKRDNVWKTL